MRNMDETKSPKKKVNWDKIIYFIVLILIIVLSFKYFFVKLLYVDAPGHVMFKSLSVRVPEDITIKEFYKNEGDNLELGDTLFSYVSTKDELEYIANMAQQGTSSNWMEREVYQLNKNIALNQSIIFEKEQLIDWTKKQIKRLEQEVILDITPKHKMESYEREIEKLTLEVETLKKQTSTYYGLINQLKGSFRPEGSSYSIGAAGASLLVKKYYKTPIEGTVTRRYKSDHEVALKSENIMNVHKREDIYIKAFFNQEEFKYVKEGDEVTVVFPDGEETVGNIKRFYFATYVMPVEFQKKHESTTRTIAADIFPIEREDQIKWKAFYKMEVRVRINKLFQ